MKYSVNLQSYKDVFVLPKSLVKQHLKFAGAVQLKVLLWLYCNRGEAQSAEELSADIGIPAADIADAMQYWVTVGLVNEGEKDIFVAEIQKDEEKSDVLTTASVSEETPVEQKSVAKAVVAAEPQRPNRREAILRGEQSVEIAWLFREAEGLFGHFVSDAERISMVWMVDNLGLESGVVRMIIQHCASVNKCNLRYIEKMAISWAEQEIDTVVKAEAYLLELEQYKNDWHTVCSAFGMEKRLPTEKEQNYAHQWIREWRFNKKMLKLAYDVCADATGKISLAYIHKVLDKWHNSGVDTPEKAAAAAEERKTSSNKKKTTPQDGKSYNIDEYEKLLLS